MSLVSHQNLMGQQSGSGHFGATTFRQSIRFTERHFWLETNFFNNGLYPASFSFIFGLFKQTSLQLLPQLYVKKCPFSIWCWDSNPRPLEYESLPVTTRPRLQVTNLGHRKNLKSFLIRAFTWFICAFQLPYLVTLVRPVSYSATLTIKDSYLFFIRIVALVVITSI